MKILERLERWLVDLLALEPRCRAEVDDEGARVLFADGRVEAVRWEDLEAVDILTTSDGPFAEDFFWVLQDSRGGCVIGGERAQELALMDRFEGLEGFDYEAVIRASGTPEEARFRCWRKREGRG